MAEEIKKEEIEQEKKQEVALPEKKERVNMVATLENGIYSSSDTFQLAFQMAKGLSQSTLVPQQYQNNPANCLVALEFANRTGQSPLQVMQSLDVIKGTPAWRGKALIAMINASRKYDEDLHFEYEEKDGKNISCYAWTKLNGTVVKGTKYTLSMAEKAGLLKKDNSYWQKEPDLMLAYRATSRFCSLNCPEISLGLYTQDEVMEINMNNNTKGKASLNTILADDDNEVLVGEVVE